MQQSTVNAHLVVSALVRKGLTASSTPFRQQRVVEVPRLRGDDRQSVWKANHIHEPRHIYIFVKLRYKTLRVWMEDCLSEVPL